jgi:hydrogenase maturation protease
LPERSLVIGVGNPDRGDDAAGLLVARLLKGRDLPQVAVMEQPGEGAALMDAWKTSGATMVFLIDAVSSGGEAGAIYRLDATIEPIPASFFHYSTHAFSLAEAVELARVLGELPPRIVIYGIEGKQYTAGWTRSPEVEQAIPVVAERIAQEIDPINR